MLNEHVLRQTAMFGRSGSTLTLPVGAVSWHLVGSVLQYRGMGERELLLCCGWCVGKSSRFSQKCKVENKGRRLKQNVLEIFTIDLEIDITGADHTKFL